MALIGFDELEAAADAAQPRSTVAAAGGADPTVLEALRTACDRGWVRPIVTGSESAIRGLAAARGIALDGFRIIDRGPDDIAVRAVAEVREGRAGLLMKGQVATPALMKGILDRRGGLRTGQAIAQVVLMEIPRDRRRFLLADTGIAIQPDLSAKIEILRGAVAVAHALGEPQPRVAMMAATESVNPAMPETRDAAELQKRNEQGEWPDCRIQGPLSFDLAYEPQAADRKGIAGEAAGTADIMIFPNLTAANLTVKAIMHTADSRFGGVLVGASHPVIFMSRADSAITRLRSLTLALAMETATMTMTMTGVERSPRKADKR